MSVPINPSSNPKHLLLLITTLLIISSGLNLLIFFKNVRDEVESFVPFENDKSTSQITSISTNDLNYYVSGDDLQLNQNINPYNNFGVGFQDLYNISWDKFLTDIKSITNADDKSANFYSDYSCINVNSLTPDTKLKFKNNEFRNKYVLAKQGLFEFLGIKPEDMKSDILEITDICHTYSYDYIVVSIHKVIDENNTSMIPKLEKAYAGGGLLPGYDRYLMVLPEKVGLNPSYITINSYHNGASGEEYGKPEIELQKFSPTELNDNRRDKDEIMTTGLGAYFGYSSIGHAGIYNSFLLLQAASGDGCCGTTSLRVLNIQTGQIKEIYGCVMDVNRTVCKNYEGKIYYSIDRELPF